MTPDRENSRKKSEEEDKLRRQIVQTTSGEKIEKALPESFLGAQNQKVDRQTVSNKKRTQVGQDAKKAVAVQSSAQPEKKAKSQLGKKGPSVPAPHLSNLGVPMIPAGSTAGREQKPEWATPGTRPEDYVKGMQEADQTALNTKEYQFYGYFQRIRERLDRAWIPILRKKLLGKYRVGRRLASNLDHSTKVMVTLNMKGEVTKVQILNESGVNDLDEAAVSAFNEAGPFPNPPKGIIDFNHEIKIPWNFVLKT